MKSTIRFSSIRSIAAAVAVSAVTVSTACAATYVPHENNFGLYDAATRGTVSTMVTPTDTRMPKTTDAMQSSSAKKAAMVDSNSFRRVDGSAQ